MPNIKSQKKRSLTNLKRAAATTSEKSALKTQMKKVLAAIKAQDKDAATEGYVLLNSLLDKAVTSGIFHKNYASRQKARFSKHINSL
ncbi:MAG TPA: 30S ribosomal protein S20 [Erysipelotrichaceae bacterium]|nr:30S ribosomal protein S20 [Erysipelotrichaceae bacterium]